MIITRTPLRVSLFGGGTDLPSYYSENTFGQVLSFAINKHIYISSHPYIDHNKILLKYSVQELVTDSGQIKHPIFRELLKEFRLNGIDISVTSDIPAGSGLGSSSAFTVALYQNLLKYVGEETSPSHLANLACKLEIERLHEPIGKQDQYASAYGGLNVIKFLKNEEVEVNKIEVSQNFINEFNSCLLLVKVGVFRFAGKILKEQTRNLHAGKNLDFYHQMRDTVNAGLAAFKDEDLSAIGLILREAWNLKKHFSDQITNSEIDNLIDDLNRLGAYGSKLLGAGGSGYILVLVDQHSKKKILEKYLDRTLDITVDREGSKVIYSND